MSKAKKMFFYESIAGHFDQVVNRYDTYKRLAVVYDELLVESFKGKKLLDAGCGTGWFSQRAVERGAQVTSMDLGENLLNEVKKKCASKRVVGSILKMPFADNSFDIVVSSEVIEHVTTPKKAIKEIYRVLKPGGVLVLTTPNRFWYFSVVIANALHLRPYQGLENWQAWGVLAEEVRKTGFVVEEQLGIHAFPFVIKATYPLLDYLHRFRNTFFGRFMVNMAIKARKPTSKA